MAVGTYALTTLARLKAYFNLTVLDHDNLIEDLIDRATALFEAFTRRKLKARDYSYESDSENAKLDGNGRDTIRLPQYPVNSLSTLRISEQEIDERDSIYSCGWILEGESGILRLACYLFTEGIQNIELAYNAGYSSVPEDLEQACIEQAAWMFKQSPAGSALLGVSSRTFADGSVSYTVRDILPQVRMVLENYKKRDRAIG